MVFSSLLLIAAVAAAPVQTEYRRTPYVGAIAVNAANGEVIRRDNEQRECYPASCTKLMTARLALKEVAAGRLSLDDRLTQSEVSFREKPSWIGIPVGKSVSVRDGFKALMVQSANDVAVMFAERIGGSVTNFVAMMNAEAARLGMVRTVYASPNGYPPPKGSKRGFDRSTAADLARLAKALIDEFPQILEYTSQEMITIPGVLTKEGGLLQMYNHNNLLVGNKKTGIRKMPEVDGLKTGYHDAGGSSIVLTGRRNGKRAIVVVVGSSSAAQRDESAGVFLSDALGALDW